MFWHLEIELISLLVISILYYYTIKMLPNGDYTVYNQSFISCLRLGSIIALVDMAAVIALELVDIQFGHQLFTVIYWLAQNLMLVLGLRYLLTILYGEDRRSCQILTVAAGILYLINALVLISNPWTEPIFSWGADFSYEAGWWFWLGLFGLSYIYLIAYLLLLYKQRKQIPAGYSKTVLIIQPLIFALAIPFQLILPAYMVGLLLSFLFFQNLSSRNEQAQLKQLTEMVEHFACGLSICHISQGQDLEVQYISSGLAVIYELEAPDLKARFQQDILAGVHPEDRELVQANIKDMVEHHQKQEMTYRFVTDAGRLKWVNVHAEAVEHKDGIATVYAMYTDLTELKKAEQMIDVALMNTGVSIWEYDFARRCIIQYQNSTEMHGFETVVPNVPQSLVESGFVHPDSAADFLAMYDKLFAGKPFAEGIFKVQTSDRKGYWYEHIRYTNSLDENGKPYRAVGMSTDETQRQEAIAKYERELEKERGFMQEKGLIVHAMFDLTAGTTLDYRYQDGTEVPEQERTTFAYAQAKAELIIDAGERSKFLALNDIDNLLLRFVAGETEFRLEYRKKLPNGMITWVRNTLRLLKDPRSGNVLLFEYWYDIEAEKMLELMYRSIATDNYDFVARIDGRTKHFDSLAKEGLTYHMPPHSGDDADQVTLTLYNECVMAEDREMVIQNCLIDNIHKHLKAYGRFVFTYRIVRPNGLIRHKRIIQYYIDAQREIIAMMREDITDLIQEEAKKNQVLSEALESANQASRAKSQFLSRVSHELRTPLNAIIGFMELAKDADANQIASYLANSDAAARQLLAIINDVLDVSSIESGKLRIAHAPFDFNRLIKNITDLYVPQCRQKGLDYETLLLTPVDEWLVGDQLRVNQILLNLLNNALKFTEIGQVYLKISQSSLRNDKVIVRFEVSDTGCGMSEEMRQRLFKPFEQESAVTAQKYGGNGLGLSIVGNLVNMMDGVVSVQSRPGEGSTFIVDIPFIKSEADIAMGMLEGAENIHVLAVDDEVSEREYMSAVLERIGVRHLCVKDGLGVLAELERGLQEKDEYNVCLIDWKMPNMNGLETTRLIRERYGSDLMIIIVSAYEHYQAEESIKAAGANRFISKPLFQSSLFDLFATLTNGRIARRNSSVDFDLKDMHLLLAEDNMMNRMVAESLILKKFGLKCECAQDGKIALEMFLASPSGYYDAILMDIQMPNMDGYEATRQIRASSHPDAQKVQIIALTANAFSEDVTKSLASGMNAHVSKPIEPEVLGAALVQAFTQRRGV